RRRNGAHQIVDRNGALSPVDDAVFGLAAAEVCAFARILPNSRRSAREQRRKRAIQRHFGCDRDLDEDVTRDIVGQDRNRRLRDDVTVVRFFSHVVQRRTGLALTVDDRPVDRRAAAIFRQQRAVHVQRSARRQRQQRGRQHPPVIKRKNEVRTRGGYARDDIRRTRILGRYCRNPVLGGGVADAVE